MVFDAKAPLLVEPEALASPFNLKTQVSEFCHGRLRMAGLWNEANGKAGQITRGEKDPVADDQVVEGIRHVVGRIICVSIRVFQVGFAWVFKGKDAALERAFVGDARVEDAVFLAWFGGWPDDRCPLAEVCYVRVGHCGTVAVGRVQGKGDCPVAFCRGSKSCFRTSIVDSLAPTHMGQ